MADHAQHEGEDHTTHLMMLGAAGLASAVVLAPYVLPFIGIGDDHTAHMAMAQIGGEAADGFYGTGIAGALQKGIASIPLVGGALTSTAPVTISGLGLTVTSGALATMLSSAVIGIGGVMLANWMEKREKKEDAIHWSKIIRFASLATSMLVSLPSILTGISVGITFLGNLLNEGWTTGLISSMASDWGLGGIAMQHGAAAGGATGALGGLLPHFFTCGAALFPFLGGAWLNKHIHAESPEPTPPAPRFLPPRFTLFSTAPLTEPAPPRITLAASDVPRIGQPCRVAFAIADPVTGRALTPADIATTHTEKLHTMIVDHALTDYHHIHPQFDPRTGLYVGEFTPKLNQPYMAWQDFTLARTGEAVQTRLELPFAGRAALLARPRAQSDVAVGDYRVHIQAEPPLRAGEESHLRVEVRGADGQLVQGLQPIMGAFSHLVGFSADGEHFVHTHPTEDPTSEQTLHDGKLAFHVMPEHVGGTQFFMQIRHQGQDITVPFGQVIAPPSQFLDREAMRQKTTHGHVHAHA